MSEDDEATPLLKHILEMQRLIRQHPHPHRDPKLLAALQLLLNSLAELLLVDEVE